MTADTLVIVPTKGRSHLIPRLLDSIESTAVDEVDIVLVVCAAEVPSYSHLLEHQHGFDVWILTAEDDATYPSKVNQAAKKYAHRYRYFAIWNDEHEAITPGWDQAFKAAIGDEPFGLAYGPDGVWEEGQVPAAPFLTTSMQTALGWVALPGLQHILVDNVWMDLAASTGALHFLPEVRIQHHHLDIGEAEPDATYAETQNNEARNQQDRETWWAWLGDQVTPELETVPGSPRAADVERLRALWGPA